MPLLFFDRQQYQVWILNQFREIEGIVHQSSILVKEIVEGLETERFQSYQILVIRNPNCQIESFQNLDFIHYLAIIGSQSPIDQTQAPQRQVVRNH